MGLLQIKSATTLIKYEKEGVIKVAIRFGNHKLYLPNHIQKLLGD